MKKFSIFDFDGTLLQTATVPFILKAWKKSKLNPKKYQQVYRGIMLRYLKFKLKVFGLKKEEFRAWTMQQVGSLLLSVQDRDRSQFLDQLFRISKTFLHPSVKRMITKDQKLGYQTILLSGNYDVFLERYRELGFDYIVGTSLFDQKGNAITNPEIIIAEKKPLVLQTTIPGFTWKLSKAYADAIYDLPLLSKVTQVIAVTPDRALRKLAMQHRWQVIESPSQA